MSGTDPARLALGHVARLQAYVPGRQPAEPGWVKLNTNECPYPPSPRVAEAVREALGDGTPLRLYPSPASTALREAVGRLHGVDPSWVCIGNGSDDLLNLLARCFCAPESPAGYTVPGYSLYPVLIGIQDGARVPVALGRDMRLPVEAIAGSKTRIFFLTTPNAPTGCGFRTGEIEALLRAYDGLLVADEAYAPFARENAAELVKAHRNLVVVRTLSKAYALAGIRIGYALADPQVIRLLDTVRDSYNVNRLSQAAALGALSDPHYYAAIVDKIQHTRDFYVEQWTLKRRWFTFPSQANFICTEPVDRSGVSGVEVARSALAFLAARKVLVRHFPSDPLTGSFLRITVGTDDQMLVLDEALEAWASGSGSP